MDVERLFPALSPPSWETPPAVAARRTQAMKRIVELLAAKRLTTRDKLELAVLQRQLTALALNPHLR